MGKLFVFSSDANPIIKEKYAKQLLRSKRQERPLKAGHPDEPMRVRSADWWQQKRKISHITKYISLTVSYETLSDESKETMTQRRVKILRNSSVA